MTLLQIDNPEGNATIGADLFTPACQTSPLCSHEICDTSLSISERVASLVNDLTLEEKVLNLVDASAGSRRIGLPAYEWWSEATHGVGSAPGVQFTPPPYNFSYATSFPSPIHYAAAFDDELVKAIGKVIGREGRAFGNNGYAGFDYWAPNVCAELFLFAVGSIMLTIFLSDEQLSRPSMGTRPRNPGRKCSARSELH
jgi:beta-D-xylosidase 4